VVTCATFPDHLTFLHLIILLLSGGEKKIVTMCNKTAVLWDVTLCRLVDRFWRVSGQTSCLLALGRKRLLRTRGQRVPQQRWHLRVPTELQGVVSHNAWTTALTAVTALSHIMVLFSLLRCVTLLVDITTGHQVQQQHRCGVLQHHDLSCGLLRASWSLAAPISTVSCRQ